MPVLSPWKAEEQQYETCILRNKVVTGEEDTGLGIKLFCHLWDFRGTDIWSSHLNNKNRPPKACLFYSPQRTSED